MQPSECSDLCLDALQHGPNFKLKGDIGVQPTDEDIRHGSVSIKHRMPPDAHEIIIEIYEQDELPDVRLVEGVLAGRRTTLKRPTVMPTAGMLQTRLDEHRSS